MSLTEYPAGREDDGDGFVIVICLLKRKSEFHQSDGKIPPSAYLSSLRNPNWVFCHPELSGTVEAGFLDIVVPILRGGGGPIRLTR